MHFCCSLKRKYSTKVGLEPRDDVISGAVFFFFQPSNPVHTYPGHMSQYLHSLLLTVGSLSKDNTQTLSGCGAIVCPVDVLSSLLHDMNNLHICSQKTKWWNKQDAQVVSSPSRLDLVRWTLAP